MKKTLSGKKNRKLGHFFFLSLPIFTGSLINLSGSLTASAPPLTLHRLSNASICLFAVKCDQAPGVINEALAGNVRGGDQAQGWDSGCFALSGKTEVAPARFSFFSAAEA